MPIHSANSRRTIQNGIDKCQPFKVASMSGERVSVGTLDYGRMPWGDERAALRARVDSGEVVYVVKSYATPIAWRDVTGKWEHTSEHYSATTTNHQSMARVASENPGFYAR